MKMKTHRSSSTRSVSLTVLLTALPITAGVAGIFDDPSNLEVLPEDISPAALRDTMRGFAMGLGARCETCHVGEAGADLSTFDFAADDKETKLKARVMLKMVAAINGEHLDGLDVPADERVRVTCVTCHRGQLKPILTEDALMDVLEKDGLDAALSEFDRLRAEYYGSHTYDFSEFVLPGFAQSLARAGRIDAAVAFARVNTKHYPESAYGYLVLGEAQLLANQRPEALASFTRSQELEPGNPHVANRIRELTN